MPLRQPSLYSSHLILKKENIHTHPRKKQYLHWRDSKGELEQLNPGLLDRQLLDYLPEHKRKYSLRLTRTPLTRYAIGALRREGYFEGLD